MKVSSRPLLMVSVPNSLAIASTGAVFVFMLLWKLNKDQASRREHRHPKPVEALRRLLGERPEEAALWLFASAPVELDVRLGSTADVPSWRRHEDGMVCDLSRGREEEVSPRAKAGA